MDSRGLVLVALAAGGYLAWRRGLLAGVLPPPPATNHTEPLAADGPAFVPWPLPGTAKPLMIENAPPAPASAPRGIRNHNPGNIRWSNDSWQGSIPRAQASDTAFVQFTAPKWGIRALAKILLTYQSKYELRTIARMIGRWAPPSENNTPAYVAAVAAAIGQSPTAVIDLYARPDLLRALIAAIIKHENGQQPYTLDQLAEGVAAAV